MILLLLNSLRFHELIRIVQIAQDIKECLSWIVFPKNTFAKIMKNKLLEILQGLLSLSDDYF